MSISQLSHSNILPQDVYPEVNTKHGCLKAVSIPSMMPLMTSGRASVEEPMVGKPIPAEPPSLSPNQPKLNEKTMSEDVAAIANEALQITKGDSLKDEPFKVLGKSLFRSSGSCSPLMSLHLTLLL